MIKGERENHEKLKPKMWGVNKRKYLLKSRGWLAMKKEKILGKQK